jgi:hypothetical protein
LLRAEKSNATSIPKCFVRLSKSITGRNFWNKKINRIVEAKKLSRLRENVKIQETRRTLMNGERKDKTSKTVLRIIVSAALAAVLAVFVFVVMHY